jgi:ligand-binding sensor domain-containing protein
VATDEGLCRLDSSTGRFEWIELPGVSARFRKLLALGLEEPNRLWIGSPNGVHAMDLDGTDIAYYPLRQASADPITSWVDSLLPDGRGGVWLGTGFLGLRLRHVGRAAGRSASSPCAAAMTGLAAEGVWMIHRDRRGRLCAATGGWAG